MKSFNVVLCLLVVGSVAIKGEGKGMKGKGNGGMMGMMGGGTTTTGAPPNGGSRSVWKDL